MFIFMMVFGIIDKGSTSEKKIGFDFVFYSGVKGILSWSKDSNSSHVEKDGVIIPQRR